MRGERDKVPAKPPIRGESAADRVPPRNPPRPDPPADRVPRKRKPSVELTPSTDVAGFVGREAKRLPADVARNTLRGARMTGEAGDNLNRLLADLIVGPQQKTTIGGKEYDVVSGVVPWGSLRSPFRARPAEPPAAPGRPPGADAIVDALPAARKLRVRQEALNRAERGKRAAAAEAQGAEVGGQAGYHAALRELKGELPKLRFGELKGEFDQAAVDRLFTHIQQLDELRPYEKLNAQRALSTALEGRVPTRGDIRWLERVFGPETAADIAASVSKWQRLKDAGVNLINVPRALKASFDLSAPFRQGLVLGARHPRMFTREWGPMLRSFASERAYQDVMDDIVSRPTFDAMQKGKLALTDLENLATGEEAFIGRNFAEKIPLVGRGVRASGRAYTAFLNKFRADAFDYYLRAAEQNGVDVADPAFLRSISTWINTATGRGGGKFLADHAVGLNAFLWSPRLIKSRIDMLNPAYYARLDPFARKQAMAAAGTLAGAASLTLALAKMAGANVSTDPRSADFAKIKVGNTRTDILGGFQQYLVLLGRFGRGEVVSSTSGELVKLEGGFADPSRADIGLRFVRQKAAPLPGYLWSWADNENPSGDKFDLGRDTARLFAPLGVEGTYDTYRQHGAGPAAGGFGLNTVGFGVQTYGPTKKKPRRRKGNPYTRGQGGAGSPYAGRGQSGRSPYAGG